MRILYFNYQISSFASILRSLEYAKGAADEGHDVLLCYLHPAFRPPESYYDLIKAYESPRLRVHYPPRKHATAPTVPTAPTASTTSLSTSLTAPAAGKAVGGNLRHRGVAGLEGDSETRNGGSGIVLYRGSEWEDGTAVNGAGGRGGPGPRGPGVRRA